MKIKILGTESLGVRGLSCSVELKNRKILIDPGLALGWSRGGLLPHPFQVAIGIRIKEKIIEELKTATDVIFSHFHGDHCPLAHPNPYQLGIHEVKNSLSACRIRARGPDKLSPVQQERRAELSELLGSDLQNAEGKKEGPLEFSFPVPHGQQIGEDNMVMMSKIEEEGKIFVHASDIQLLDRETIQIILDWKPDVVLVSGPPLYRFNSPSFHSLKEQSRQNAMELCESVETVIIDHHLLRSSEGINWLHPLKNACGNKISHAADFMKREAIFLEAWRNDLYQWLPVAEGWHEDYKEGKIDTEAYRIRGWQALIDNRKIQPCQWYYVCPIKEYTDTGKLERYWIEEYCLVSNKNCVRYHMEERGEYHPDNMLPNGEIREELE